MTTDGNGYAKSAALVAGTYYVKEITAPKGYVLSGKVHTLLYSTVLIKRRAVSSDSISHSTARYSYNPDGRCGSVAGAIVLNYYDRYKSPSYVPNSLESSDECVALINALVMRL